MQTLKTKTARFARQSPVGRFLRHYGEMVLAMVVGMVVLGMPLAAVLGDDEMLMLVNMGVSMTVPMVAWMRYRGHGWQVTTEMAAAMVVPTMAAMTAFGTGLVDDFGAVMLGEHVVMLLAMAGAMLARPSEYLHHDHGAAAAA
jgi:hypothetical protein